MLPKRKLIKKSYRKPKSTNEEPQLSAQGIFQKLKSIDTSSKEQAILFIANLCFIPSQVSDPQILAELIKVIHLNQKSLIHSCLFAISNLCQLQPKIIQVFFDLGLQKALLSLKAADKQLLKPTMALMKSIVDHIPQKYRYLVKGIESSLTVQHLSSPGYDLVLEFFYRIDSDSLSEEINEKIYHIFQNDNNIKNRSLAICVLLKNESIRPKIMQKFVEFINQVITNSNLQEQYDYNIKPKQSSAKSILKQIETDLMDDEGQGQKVELVNQKDGENYEMFINSIQSVQIAMEGVLCLFEQEWEEDEEDNIEDQEQEIGGNGENHNQKSNDFKDVLIKYFTSNAKGLIRNLTLSFLQSQNIAYLSLRMLCHLPIIDRQQIAKLTMKSIENTFILSPPRQVLLDNLAVALNVLLKCHPAQSYRQFLIQIGEKGLLIKESDKDCWLRLLELYSLSFNPQKMAVTTQQNYKVARILQNLIINIPHLELEEWRGQAIDTLFDVFSNQNFDKTFMELEFPKLLKHIFDYSQGKKKNKFIKLVLIDIERFLAYKKEKIHF